MNPTIFQLLLICSGIPVPSAPAVPAAVIKKGDARNETEIYEQINWDTQRPDFEVFYSAVKGYNFLQDSLHVFEKPLLTIVDFSRPSNIERLWVVNLETRELLLQTLVAHGRNSGEVIPNRFSNKFNSFQSSLGFYRTGIAYAGKHGLSLKLHGMEEGINDQAERRAIVIHGADYVSEKYVARNGRLGRSQGCPAVAMGIHKQLIKAIRDNTCLFVYFPEKVYFERSIIFKEKMHDSPLAYDPGANGGKF